jgi:hypothetical protein
VFSIRGMVVLFPGAPVTMVGMAGMMEAAKLVTAGLARRPVERDVPDLARCLGHPGRWPGSHQCRWRLLAVAAHVGERGAAQAAVEMRDAAIAARIELAAGKVADPARTAPY